MYVCIYVCMYVLYVCMYAACMYVRYISTVRTVSMYCMYVCMYVIYIIVVLCEYSHTQFQVKVLSIPLTAGI